MAFQDFDLIAQRRQEEKKNKFKQRLIVAFILSVIVILLVAAAVCLLIYKTTQGSGRSSHHHAPPLPPPKTAKNMVKSFCATTDYKKTCEESIMKEVKNNASATPMQILRASLSAAAREVDGAIKEAKGFTFDTPVKVAAYNVCMILLKDAKDELNSSVMSVKGKDIRKLPPVKPEINNWLSAVISYQQTCIDGFTEGKEKEQMRKLLVRVRMLGSNALAVVASVATVLAKLEAPAPAPAHSHRRLSSFEYPTWMNREQRRFLKADATKLKPNVTVAKDKTGNFTTINEALKAMPKNRKGRYRPVILYFPPTQITP